MYNPVSSGSFCENYRSSSNTWAVFQRKSDVLIITKYGMGYSLGDFFPNASGHPGNFILGYENILLDSKFREKQTPYSFRQLGPQFISQIGQKCASLRLPKTHRAEMVTS
jgi:hypothetical protein